MKKDDNKDLFIWNIDNINYNYLINSINKFDLNTYIEKFLKEWYVKQSYDNFMKISNLLYKYNSK
jgi:hypothetical protein